MCAGRRAAPAALSRSENTLPGGPTSATYWLFADQQAVESAFAAIANSPEWVLATCPGASSAGPIPLLRADGTRAGSIACLRAGPGFYTSDKDRAVTWTRDADKFDGMAYVGYRGQGYPADLYEWATTSGA